MWFLQIQFLTTILGKDCISNLANKYRYSGITPQLLSNVTTTLPIVQKELSEMIHSETILAGHSLENDLIALKVVHTKVMDTALLFPRQGANTAGTLLYILVTYLPQALNLKILCVS